MTNKNNININSDVIKELYARLSAQQEENVAHLDYNNEFGLYYAITDGNEKEVNDVKKKHKKALSDIQARGLRLPGSLSSNPLQNSRYHFVIMAALISRICVDTGLDREISYILCDIYINRADKSTSLEALDELRDELISTYTQLMQSVKKHDIGSHLINKCVDYIKKNLNKKLTLEEIAEEMQLSPSYLSKLFQKEMGISISAYIKKQKIITSARMLEFTEYKITDIAEYFEFSSQSHYTALFKKEFGVTPKQYRDVHYGASQSQSKGFS